MSILDREMIGALGGIKNLEELKKALTQIVRVSPEETSFGDIALKKREGVRALGSKGTP